jgi:hypothetical protein
MEENEIENQIGSKPINLTLSVDQVNVVLTGLSKLPFELVNQLMTIIHIQAEPQYTSHKEEIERDSVTDVEDLSISTAGDA